MVLSAAAEVCRESAPAFATQEPNLALLLIVITGGSVRLGRPWLRHLRRQDLLSSPRQNSFEFLLIFIALNLPNPSVILRPLFTDWSFFSTHEQVVGDYMAGITRVLISVSDKTGVVEMAKGLRPSG